MIQFVQTGEYRTRSIRIKRFVNAVEVTGDGFPIVESLLLPFDNEIELSENQLIDLTDAAYSSRVEAFKSYLLGKYSFLSVGDFSNTSSGIDNVTCVPDHITSSGDVNVTQDTQVTIFFDSSGSMNSTLAPLIEMKNTLLKAALLPFYNMDENLYQQKVRVISEPEERTLSMLANRGTPFTDPHLIMVFQDESNHRYHSSTSMTTMTAMYDEDITALRAMIASKPANTYRGVIFQVIRNAGEGYQFKNLVQAIENGHAGYPLPYNLSDRAEIGYQYDVISGKGPQYYMDIVLQKMRELGYRI